MRVHFGMQSPVSLSFAVEGCSALKGRRGRHQTNLLSVIRNDIKRIPVNRFSENHHLHYKLTLKNQHDINVMRELASNRKEWSKLYNYVV